LIWTHTCHWNFFWLLYRFPSHNFIPPKWEQHNIQDSPLWSQGALYSGIPLYNKLIFFRYVGLCLPKAWIMNSKYLITYATYMLWWEIVFIYWFHKNVHTSKIYRISSNFYLCLPKAWIMNSKYLITYATYILWWEIVFIYWFHKNVHTSKIYRISSNFSYERSSENFVTWKANHHFPKSDE
jgi:hypothetical protein